MIQNIHPGSEYLTPDPNLDFLPIPNHAPNPDPGSGFATLLLWSMHISHSVCVLLHAFPLICLFEVTYRRSFVFKRKIKWPKSQYLRIGTAVLKTSICIPCENCKYEPIRHFVDIVIFIVPFRLLGLRQKCLALYKMPCQKCGSCSYSLSHK